MTNTQGNQIVDLLQRLLAELQNLHEWKVEGALEEVLVLLTCVQYYRLVARRQDALDTDGEMTIL